MGLDCVKILGWPSCEDGGCVLGLSVVWLKGDRGLSWVVAWMCRRDRRDVLIPDNLSGEGP